MLTQIKKSNQIKWTFFVCSILLGFSFLSHAQQPVMSMQSTEFKVIDILKAKRLGKDNEYQYAAGNVIMRQERTYFYCDSVSLNTLTGLMEAFGRVHINDHDSVHTYSDFLRYKGKERTAFLKGNVKLTDGSGTLTTEQLDYDMNTSVGVYKNGGKLVNGKTVLTSKEGIYYGDTRDVTFKKNVLLVDPQYRITTDSLLYNTATRIAVFVVPTDIQSGSNRRIATRDGTYNMDTRQAYFGSRPTIVDSTTTLIADEVAYDDRSGFGEARGSAVLKDTAQGVVVIANNIKTNRKESAFLATVNPLAILTQESDSTYISGDTIYSGRLSDRLAGIEYKQLADTTAEMEIIDSVDYNIQENVDTEVKPHLRKEVLPGNTLRPVINTPKQQEREIEPKVAEPGMEEILGIEKKDSLTDAFLHIVDSADEKSFITDSLPPVDRGKITPSVIERTKISNADTTRKTTAEPAGLSFPTTTFSAADTSQEETNNKDRFIEVYYNVKIFNDSLQAVSDSMFYSSQDSVFRLFRDPIVWTNSNNQFTQMTGDTIYVFTQNRKPKKIDVWKNALIISQSYQDSLGHLNDYYNQLTGTYIYAYLTDGAIDSMQSKYNAQSIYYLVDEQNKYLGVNQQQSNILDFYFENKQLSKIVGRQDVSGTTYPMRQVDHNAIRLKGYQLYNDLRPKTKYELFAPAVEAPQEDKPEKEAQEETAGEEKPGVATPAATNNL